MSTGFLRKQMATNFLVRRVSQIEPRCEMSGDEGRMTTRGVTNLLPAASARSLRRCRRSCAARL